jgi:hypothetical protein
MGVVMTLTGVYKLINQKEAAAWYLRGLCLCDFAQTEVYATGEKLFEDIKLVIEGVVSLAAQSMMTDMNTGAPLVYAYLCMYAVCTHTNTPTCTWCALYYVQLAPSRVTCPVPSCLVVMLDMYACIHIHVDK